MSLILANRFGGCECPLLVISEWSLPNHHVLIRLLGGSQVHLIGLCDAAQWSSECFTGPVLESNYPWEDNGDGVGVGVFVCLCVYVCACVSVGSRKV